MSEIAIEELSSRLGSVCILDVRTRAEFDGTAGNACDPRQGHIPGAIHLDVQQLVQFDRAQIEAAVGVASGAELVAYCHSGSRSAVATQLLRGLGYDARNYLGSWHEWSRRDDLAIET